ncbi:NAD(P)/FAD-dependent oxidoreductase [Chryseobacterium sp. NKUCC03_KSP]|uniref:phytoene desaturase family protein n=1 Tax=Chryseobacterium sp. NKUCC03_KSP TaxID=2842125 RepID=UPI001C5AAC5D|nr:NAD(P)/FAD-dependent oxidoreductase [Chryseobacterium sp. NKUCC03_KSP]MBW3524816.1 NAD(P)/FAD-dependent oxidoreductase [Chryseobacterium sp. NKUCC03_KSP]
MVEEYDIAIFGGGISGFSAALRLQNKGLKTIVFESHGQLGGCAGFFTKKGFSFDVGATTLVDFIEGGVGGNFFKDIKLDIPKGKYIDYIAWLPDRQITLYQDAEKWKKERLDKIGSTQNHIEFWKLMDEVTKVFWAASRKNIKLPIRTPKDIYILVKCIGIKNLHLVKYLNSTILDIVKKYNLKNDKPLVGLLSMLIEDTVHSTIDKAPFINSALGVTIRGAGLMRAEGGMKSFWNHLSNHYLKIGGTIKKGNKVLNFKQENNSWNIKTSKGSFKAKKVINSLPIDLLQTICPDSIKNKLQPFIAKNEKNKGSAIVVFLGVPENEVSNQTLDHHQILLDYESKLGKGNNMFISVSEKDDHISAPQGFRSVMISTHCEIAEWQNLSEMEYQIKKQNIGLYLIEMARKVYPNLGQNPIIYEIGTPLTYQKFTNRIHGSVGGFKQTKENANLKAVPQDIGVKNFWLTGDNTWPGLGTVAGLISGRIASEYAEK